MKAFKPIVTERIRLRPFLAGDLAAFAAYRNEPSIARYQSWTSFTLDDARALHAEMTGKAFGLHDEWYQLALAERGSDRILGDLALHVIDGARVEIGFTLAPEAQGKGFAREGVKALLDFVFGTFGRSIATAVTDARNTPSIRLLEAVGFEQLPNARHLVFKGEPIVELDFECRASRWPDRHA
jgi:RimJ/RimL family protein N-acetyltransferase